MLRVDWTPQAIPGSESLPHQGWPRKGCWAAGTSVRYGASGAPKNTGPQPNSPPRPAERPGAGRVFLVFPAPAPAPARSLDGSPLKQVGRNGAPSRQ